LEIRRADIRNCSSEGILRMGRLKCGSDKSRPKKPDPAKSKPPARPPAGDDDSDRDAGDIATPEPDRDDEQRGL
jgi:hypothetical protein